MDTELDTDGDTSQHAPDEDIGVPQEYLLFNTIGVYNMLFSPVFTFCSLIVLAWLTPIGVRLTSCSRRSRCRQGKGHGWKPFGS